LNSHFILAIVLGMIISKLKIFFSLILKRKGILLETATTTKKKVPHHKERNPECKAHTHNQQPTPPLLSFINLLVEILSSFNELTQGRRGTPIE
jgi:hypothetical protein